ncbi:hypothetical protein F2Q68_00024765 [Brassica cretica]|uniref:Replication factor A C-terminal domain-containing protein n=1 Tax=Brassica cretica TaxID=69181 RepID=A0A8S9IEQ5_BRACR|nr:hypothetical protein F2Q68_00024765 [Brassica cretica]
MATKPNGKSPVSSDYDEKVMFFRDVSLGPHETQMRFRLIHYWEAWNPLKKTLIGLEMFLIDEQGTVIQGFISPGRIEKYLPKMKRGSVYKLNNFYGSISKSIFWVADHTATMSFSWNSELSVLQDSPTPFDENSFRFHSYEDFQANCDLKGDFYGYERPNFFDVCAKCGNVNIAGAQYRAQISVYDNSEQAVFVLLGDAGRALTGKHASELVSSYFEANGNQGVNHEVPVPEALISTIGQRHKFCVKATKHNLSGKTRSLTVSKILSLDTPPATEALAGNHIAATSEETFQTGNDV